MAKRIELLGQFSQGVYEENVTEIGHRIVKIIDLKDMICERMITMFDRDNKKVCTLYIPETTLVKVEYL